MSDSDASSHPDAGVKVPRDPEGLVPGEVQPTAEEDAADAVMRWLTENPDTNAGSVRILDDHKTVVVYWKGDPPAELQEFVASQPGAGDDPQGHLQSSRTGGGRPIAAGRQQGRHYRGRTEP